MATIYAFYNKETMKILKRCIPQKYLCSDQLLEMMIERFFLKDSQLKSIDKDNIFIPYYGNESYREWCTTGKLLYKYASVDDIITDIKTLHYNLMTYDTLTVLYELIVFDQYETMMYTEYDKKHVDNSFDIVRKYAEEFYIKKGFYCAIRTIPLRSKNQVVGVILYSSRSIYNGGYYFHYDNYNKSIYLKLLMKECGPYKSVYRYNKQYAEVKKAMIPYQLCSTLHPIYPTLPYINKDNILIPATIPIGNNIFRKGLKRIN